jgi:hypothetical protein
MATKRKLDLNGMGYGPVVGFFEHDDKYSLSTNNGNLIFVVISSFIYVEN